MLNKLLSLAFVLGVAMLPSTEAVAIKARDNAPPSSE